MGQTQINFQIGEDEKEEWKGYVEGAPETSSLSHLIRLSVSEHMAGSDGEDRSDRTQQSPEASGEILEYLNRIETNVSDVGERLDVLERESNPTYDLQRAIFHLLPENDRSTDDVDGIGVTGLSFRTGADPDTIRDAIDEVRQGYTGVGSFEVETDDGTRTRYYRRGGN
jgi:hypothetical protein